MPKEKMSGVVNMSRSSTNIEDFQEVFDATVLCMDARNYSLEVGETFRNVTEVGFEGWMVHEILYGVETATIHVNRLAPST